MVSVVEEFVLPRQDMMWCRVSHCILWYRGTELIIFRVWDQGRIQDFKLGGAAHLKKSRRAEGGAKIVGVFRVKNHDFTQKNHFFSNIRGGARRVPPPLDPPLEIYKWKSGALILCRVIHLLCLCRHDFTKILCGKEYRSSTSYININITTKKIHTRILNHYIFCASIRHK